MEKRKNAKLISGPVGKTLFKLTIPMTFGILGIIGFNLVDTFFVSRLGTVKLAAISFTFPVVFLIGGFSMGIGSGASAVISRAIGRGNHHKVQRLTTDSLLLALLTVSIFVIVGVLTLNKVFILLGAPPEILPLIRQYMLIWYPGMIFIIVPMVGNNAIRATGDTLTAGMIMIIAVFLNSVLDPFLIFGIGPFPRLELAGAAIATVISRAITLIISLYVLYFRKDMIDLTKSKFSSIMNSWKNILYIGLPSGTTNIVFPVGIGIITHMVSKYGADKVAAFGVATRIETLALTIIMALGSVLSPFVGQNWGAKRHDRLNTGIKYSLRFSMIWGFSMIILLFFLSKPLSLLFSSNHSVLTAISTYLMIVPVSYGLYGVLMLSYNVLNVLHKPILACLLALIYIFIFYVPLAYSGSYLFNLNGIFCGIALSRILCGIAIYFILKKVLLSEENKSQPDISKRL